MSKVNVPTIKGKRVRLGFYTIKKIEQKEYLCYVKYEENDKGKLKQKWRSLGNILDIGPGHEHYDKLLKAYSIIIGKEAGDIYERYKRGKLDKDKALNEFKKLLDR